MEAFHATARPAQGDVALRWILSCLPFDMSLGVFHFGELRHTGYQHAFPAVFTKCLHSFSEWRRYHRAAAKALRAAGLQHLQRKRIKKAKVDVSRRKWGRQGLTGPDWGYKRLFCFCLFLRRILLWSDVIGWRMLSCKSMPCPFRFPSLIPKQILKSFDVTTRAGPECPYDRLMLRWGNKRVLGYAAARPSQNVGRVSAQKELCFPFGVLFKLAKPKGTSRNSTFSCFLGGLFTRPGQEHALLVAKVIT